MKKIPQICTVVSKITNQTIKLGQYMKNGYHLFFTKCTIQGDAIILCVFLQFMKCLKIRCHSFVVQASSAQKVNFGHLF